MNYDNVFVTLLDILNIKHTTYFSNKFFNEHNHKYNMSGLSDMLSDYGIKNQGFRFKDKNSALKELEPPFITKIDDNFVVIFYIDNKKIGYIHKNKNITELIEDFIKRWSGVVLLTEHDEFSEEPDYNNHRKTVILHFLKNISLILACIFILGIIGYKTNFYNNIFLITALLINIFGIYICYLLILKQVNIQNHIANKICSFFNYQSDCNNILDSDAAKIFGFSWSEIGLGYFIGNALIILTLPEVYSYLALINICALPFSLWSIWYQKFKAKQWCLLCLIIQCTLWFQFLYNLFAGLIFCPVFNFQNIMMILCIYFILVLFLNIFNSILSESKLKEKILQELNSLKSNEQLFNILIKEKKKYEVHKSVSTILLGNLESANLITVVSNPHCNPCAQLHKEIKQILKNKANECCIQYIFSSFGEEFEDSNRFIISMYKKLNEKDFLLFLDEWYYYGRYNKVEIFRKYKYCDEDINTTIEFNNQKEWLNKTKITTTPTILYKGYEIPSQIYKIGNLLLFSKLKIS